MPDISGPEWSFQTPETQVQSCAAVVAVSDEGMGKIIRYDAEYREPGSCIRHKVK